MKKTNKGFSLLELLIVVAIILIIATIAIPSLLRSRQAANESAAVATLRTINTAEVTYLSSSGGNYGDLGALVSVQLLDNTFSALPAKKGGYNYFVEWSASTPTDYTAYAEPASGNTGRYGYYSVPDAVVRYSTNSATSNGKPGQAVN
jgi:prepilin-type N-terminal cleavage/methylation domain-containing protein